jgi:hypothetical protein
MNLGYRFKGVDFEEKVLYSMASKYKMFDSSMLRYREKPFYKNFFAVIEIPHIGYLDASLKQDLKFYARFLAIYVSKMKRNRVLKDPNFDGDSLKKESEEWKKKLRERMRKEYDRWTQQREKYLQLDEPGYVNFIQLLL